MNCHKWAWIETTSSDDKILWRLPLDLFKILPVEWAEVVCQLKAQRNVHEIKTNGNSFMVCKFARQIKKNWGIQLHPILPQGIVTGVFFFFNED